MPSWQVHGHRLLCGIQRGQLIFQLSRVGWLDAGLRTVLKNFSKPECLNVRITSTSVMRNDTVVNLRSCTRPIKMATLLLVPLMYCSYEEIPYGSFCGLREVLGVAALVVMAMGGTQRAGAQGEAQARRR